jgi:ubiquinone/menaquinone biosynthesis C-methylase UbiE
LLGGGRPIYAAVYNRLAEIAELRGLRAMRAELICQAAGVVVELGAGTGHNLAHYTDSVTQLILTEPDPHMARRLRARLEAAPPAAQAARVVDAPAERLPVADGSIDVVVATLVLCTVSDPAAAVAEVERVLRPAGRLFLIEHVRSPDARLARWQDRLERPWGWFVGGCHPSRDTAGLIAASSLEPVRIDSGDYPRIMGPLIRPMIRGVARAPAA